jgi:hypothetical protein
MLHSRVVEVATSVMILDRFRVITNRVVISSASIFAVVTVN